MPLATKNRAMRFMAPILELPQQDIGPVIDGLRAVTVYDFPVRSSDILAGSPQYNDYIDAIDTLFALLRDSCNLRILELLYPVLRDEQHVHILGIHRGLSAFVSAAGISTLLDTFRMCYRALLDPLNPYMLQYVLITNICVPILSKLHVSGDIDVLLDLFDEYVALLADNIPKEANVTTARKYASADPPASKRHAPATVALSIEHNLVVQICTFDLLREFYTLISDKGLIHGRVNQQYVSIVDPSNKKAKGSELTQRVSMAAYSAKIAQHHVGPEVPTMLLRNYHQSAYNCLAAVIIRTQNKDVMFTELLLEEKTKTNHCWWTNIVPTMTPFKFQVSTNFSVIRKSISELRTENDLFQESAMDGGSGMDRRNLSRRFMDSSSLNIDAESSGGFWTSDSSQESHASALNSFAPMMADSLGAEDGSHVAGAGGAIAQKSKKIIEAYEFDVINSIPCMPTILHVIDTMCEKFRYSDNSQMPGWMVNLVKVMDNDNLHPNVRLFIGKIIVLRAERVFKPYATFLYAPLLRLCTTTLSSQDGLTYYLRDMCVMFLLSFRSCKPGLEFRPLLADFSGLLLKCLPWSNRTVVKENVRLFHMLYQQWKDRFPIDKRLVLALLKQSQHGEMSATARAIGLQLVSMLITVGNGPPHEPDDEAVVREEDFYRTLLSCLDFKSQRVYVAGAEVVGQVLAVLSKNSSSLFAMKQALKDKIDNMHQKKQLDRMIICLQQICVSAPEFCDQYFGKIFDFLSILAGDFKIMALDVIAQRVEHIENLMQHMRSHLVSLLENREARAQLLALKIMKPLVSNMDIPLLDLCLKPLSEFPNNQSVECRRKAYEILRTVWDLRPELHGNAVLRVALLRGLADPEEKKQLLEEFRYSEREREDILNHKSISEIMLEFWNNPRQLSESSSVRLDELLTTGYDPEIESDWLSFAPSLLLQLCAKNQQSKEKLFEHQLDAAAQFVAVNIDTRTVMGATAGMDRSVAFSQSATGASVLGSSFGAGGGASQEEYQSLAEFTNAHKSSGSHLPSVHFTATGAQTVASNQLSFAEFGGSLSNDPALYNRKDLVKSMWKKPELPGQKPTVVDDRVEASNSQIILGVGANEGQDSEKEELFTRFRPAREGMSSPFDIVALQKKRQKYALLSRYQSAQQNAKLALSRTYEMGVLPNIGITPEEFLGPLRILSMRDKALSSSLLGIIIEGMIQASPGASRTELLQSLEDRFEALLGQSVYDGAFVSFILRVCSQQAQIFIPDELVGEAANKSFSYHSGALLLEKQIQGRREDGAHPNQGKRRKREDRNSHLQHRNPADFLGWKPLASLYKELGDDDVLTGIYDKHLAQHSFTHDAIHRELMGDYEGAWQIYESGGIAAQNPAYDWQGHAPRKDELDLWEDGRLECLENMIRWGDLAECAKAEAEHNLGDLWTIADEQYRHLYVRGSYRCQEYWAELFQFTDNALVNEEHADWLKTHYGPELAMLSIVRDDFPRARALCSQALGTMLSSWRSLHPLARNGRLKLLQRLQLVKEMQEVLNFLKYESSFETIQPLERLVSKWANRWPLNQTSITVWDSIAYGRELLLDKLKQRFVYRERAGAQQQLQGLQFGNQIASKERVELLIADCNVSNWRRCTKAGMKQRNLAVATQFQTFCVQAENIRAGVEDLAGSSVDVPSTCVLVKLFEKKASHGRKIEDRVKNLAKAIDYFETRPGLSSNILESQPRNYILVNRLSSKLYLKLHQYLGEAKSQPAKLDSLIELAQSKQVLPLVDSSNYAQNCLKMSYTKLKDAYRVASSFADQDAPLVAKTCLRMAQFCELMLATKERSAESRAQYARHVIEPILQAVALNSREASDLIPRVVVLLSENRDHARVRSAFTNGMAACPSWMFIRWISYLLSNLSDPVMAEHMLPSLMKMASDYPVAMYFPFTLSSDKKFLSTESQRLVEPLRKKLKAPVLEKFMFHLMLLQHPEHRLHDWLEETRRLRLKKGSSDELLSEWKEFYALTLDSRNREYGSYNRDWASSVYATKVLKLAGGVEGKKLVGKLLDDKSLREVSKAAKGKVKRGTILEEVVLYSRWLSEFDLSQLRPEERSLMEVPGQYFGYTGKPDPSSHVLIASFSSQILTMGSIRKPKKLTMLGTNQKSFPWLVKGGEDVRQDQRIEELWLLMNDLMRNNTSTSSRGLLLETYQVVPMSPKLGILEWREGTMSLKGLLEGEGLDVSRSGAEHSQWMAKFVISEADAQNPSRPYHRMVVEANRANALAKWDSHQQKIVPHLMTSAIHSIACSPESFLCLRNGFARSLAVMSVAGYVAGIGDRHLDNILVDVEKGLVVGIDFGHAFGSGVFQIGIPELVPFRLTPQLVNFLNPLGPEGLLMHNMTHVLQCFVDNKMRLLNLMQIFLNEPHMDWVQMAEKFVATAPDSVAVFAEKRMKLLRDKLSLRNPAFITYDELGEHMNLKMNPPALKAYQNLAKGSAAHNVRAQVEEYCESLSQQVECLIDQATDPNILSRSWAGWSSHL